MKKTIIVAPHEDDEIIGCFEVIEKQLMAPVSTIVLYPNTKGEVSWSEEAKRYNPLGLVPVTGKDCDSYFEVMNGVTFFFPDPIHEFHPEHRRLAAIGENLLRGGATVFFYSVNMQAPYIRETKMPDLKKEALNFYYPQKADLWKWDHKYFLFEGQCRWIGGW